LKKSETYRIGMLGLPEIEQRVLKSIGRISSNRVCAYEFLDVAPSSNSHEARDVLLVDADSQQAVQSWERAHSNEPTVFITSTEVAGQKFLKRPLLGARLLVLLDEVVEKLRPPPPVAIEASDTSKFALVVDDSPTVRKHIELGLASLGLTVHVAGTGEEALDLLGMNKYDIVFLDVVLPGIDGYEVCKVIKKNKNTKNIPVIMLTGKSSTFDRIKGSLAGCDTYLTKPVEYQVFKSAVSKYLFKSASV
jgi:twitching motility two-component system response regulator PilG